MCEHAKPDLSDHLNIWAIQSNPSLGYRFNITHQKLYIKVIKQFRKRRVKLGNCRSEWENMLRDPLWILSYNMSTIDMLFILDDDIDIYHYAYDNTFLM